MVGTTDALSGQIGTRVREARAGAGLSIEEVARSLLISIEMFNSAERGHVRFTASHIADLCDLFDRMPSWFFEPDNATRQPM